MYRIGSRRRLHALVAVGGIGLAVAAVPAVSGGRDERAGSKVFSAYDEQYLMGAIEGDHFEIAGGQSGQKKGASQQARDLAARLERDHSKSLHESIAIAQRLGIDVPHKPSPSQVWEIRAVNAYSGEQFDHWYADLEVQDHMQDIQEAKDEVAKGTNPQIVKSARKELPILREHLKLSEAVLAASP
jgi:predicted outer membrane protein